MKYEYIKVNGELITDAGKIVRVDSQTKTRVRGTVVDVFFPKHKRQYSHGHYQITGNRADYLRELIIGQKHEFWLTGSRAGYQVGGNEQVVDWTHPREVA